MGIETRAAFICEYRCRLTAKDEEMRCGDEMFCIVFGVTIIFCRGTTHQTTSGLKLMQFCHLCRTWFACSSTFCNVYWGYQLSGLFSYSMTDTESGSFRSSSGTGRASLLPRSISQSQSYGQPRFKGRGNRFHVLMGRAVGTYRERRHCWQLFGHHLTQFVLLTWVHIFV